MNWESSEVITPLKRDFLRAFYDSGQRFFLTDGSAVGIFYLQHRLSFDLDFFTTERSLDLHRLENDVRAVARRIAAGLRITPSPAGDASVANCPSTPPPRSRPPRRFSATWCRYPPHRGRC